MTRHGFWDLFESEVLRDRASFWCPSGRSPRPSPLASFLENAIQASVFPLENATQTTVFPLENGITAGSGLPGS